MGGGELEIEWKSMSDLDVDVKVTSFIPIPTFSCVYGVCDPKIFRFQFCWASCFSFYIIR